MSQIKVEYINHCGDDLSVVNAARCSFDKESEWLASGSKNDYEGVVYQKINGFPVNLKKEDAKLINYLASHKHYSPFNHSFISVRVKAPVFVARQLVKHKFMPWNEVSRRYVKGEVEFYKTNEWRKAADNVKQGSSSEVIENCRLNISSDTASNYLNPDQLNDVALEIYNGLLEEGVCAEQARQVLPQSMMTTWVWSGTLGAFCDMLKLRLDPHTQYETRLVAQEVSNIVKELFPVSYKALVGEE